MAGLVEGPGGLDRQMPLTSHVGPVTDTGQQLRPEPSGGALDVKGAVHRLGLPDAATREEHGAAGDADRRTPRTHVLRMGEGGSAGHQTVEIRRLHHAIAEGVQGLETIIVGEEEEDVGPTRRRRINSRGQQEDREE